jgi:hypothetical protein
MKVQKKVRGSSSSVPRRFYSFKVDILNPSALIRLLGGMELANGFLVYRWVDVPGAQNIEQKPDLKAHHNNAVLKDITWVLQFELNSVINFLRQ